MPQEAPDKGVGRKLCHLHTVALAAVTKDEAHLIPLQVEQTMVGNRHAMGIAPQIVQRLLGAAKGAFRVDDPLVAPEALEEGVEGLGGLKSLARSGQP